MAPPPVALFPAPPSVKPADSPKLRNAVAAAVNAVVGTKTGKPAAPFGVTLIDVNNSVTGGFNEDAEHYAASVVKIGCLYAAHALLDMVRRYNTLRAPGSEAALFKGLRSEMDTAIAGASATIIGGTSGNVYRVPNYEAMFTAKKLGSALTVGFAPSYAAALKSMTIPSSNEGAARCIHGVGYSYLNGLLENHGFFKVSGKDKKGVWLGGDYTGAWHYVRIDCVNDKDTAQGATSRTIAHLMAVILLDSVLPAQSHKEMTALLEGSAHGPDPSWLLRAEVSNRLDKPQVTHAKIGIGPLKSGGDVYSEATMLKNVGARRYVLGFTNIDYNPYSLIDLVTVVREAIKAYESP